MMIESDLQIAIQVARSGETERAYQLFVDFIQKYPFSFQGYLWLSELAKTLEEQTFALERAQALCPPDPQGLRDLQFYLNELRGAIPLAAPAAKAAPATIDPATADSAAASDNLNLQTQPAPEEPTNPELFYQTERFSLFEEQDEQKSRLSTRPNLDQHWITIPSAVLFALFVFIQFDWQIFSAPFLVFSGLVTLLAGALLITASSPHPLLIERVSWLNTLEAIGSIQLRRNLRWSGLLLVFMPFTILLRATMLAGLH